MSSKIAIISDIHIGNSRKFGGETVGGINCRGRLVLDVLDQAVVHAQREGANFLMCLGDLFDTVRPSPQMIGLTRGILGRFPYENVTLLLGNHEMVTDRHGDNALAAMDSWIDRPTKDIVSGATRLIFPFHRWTGQAPEAHIRQRINVPPGSGTAPMLLFLHMGVISNSTAPYLKASQDAITEEALWSLMLEYDIQATFSGDWHQHYETILPVISEDNQRTIFQVGALCPTGFDNPGLNVYGKMILLTVPECTCAVVEIPGPRFLALDFEDGWERPKVPDGTSLFIRFRAHPKYMKEAIAEINVLKETGAIVDGEVVPNVEVSKSLARNAARAARRASTVDEAVRAYVSRMALSDGIDRGTVLAEVIDLLRSAS